ncbi:hypothetical protein LSH36_989g00024 [Paralvinella palmiformis]|uniref:Uncharacterized protein n=1 Tax=Paralvinella palmiformis TaxID=53620 RepID=A0AAD9IWD7_9ANNE|nr:hypothetical protein LSH36_989g00024 [Paralvinella palmiformis]
MGSLFTTSTEEHGFMCIKNTDIHSFLLRIPAIVNCKEIDPEYCTLDFRTPCQPCSNDPAQYTYNCPGGVYMCSKECLNVGCDPDCMDARQTVEPDSATLCSASCGIGTHNVTYLMGATVICEELCCCMHCEGNVITVPPANVCSDAPSLSESLMADTCPYGS